ncbi:hypothetical protein [Flagellimonas flava]|uniref:Uncharacterized protein n=1 Tax=Flagellimonas flava TaxID=570519 RepID=A0A1M5NRK8_9FLAO|nr:hypothetical protein [Allomuricauda flava]SHG92191.1 hypothetical protein SAMN04488116_2943 [Allomuricauda flava]
MKKAAILFFSIMIIALGAWSLNSFSNKISPSNTENVSSMDMKEYGNKYSDCINGSELDSFTKQVFETNFKTTKLPVKSIDKSLENYQRSLEVTIENLNAIDAHDFLHSEYERYKTEMSQETLSGVRAYYLAGAMKVCFNLDKSLNQDSNHLPQP